MKFFKMWWDHQNENMRQETKKLIKNGQLELINGGWSMHDEACPTYDDMINNMMIGHLWLADEFGVLPRIGWQPDPFGHSNTNTRLFAEMGFDALFFARLDYKDQEKRDLKEREFVWMPSKDTLGPDVNILSHVLYNSYYGPPGYSFDILDNNPPWVNDKESDTYNAPDLANTLDNLLEN